MDPGRGRRTTFPTARLTVIALLIGVLVILRQGVDGASAEAAEPGVASASAAEESSGASEPSTAPAAALAPIPDEVRAAREAAVESVIATWMKNLERESGGKADADDAVVAVHAVELGPERGGLLATRLADRSLLPASNMKLVTSIAALCRLTPEGQFVTRVVSDARVTDGVLAGDLVVRAGGDPLTDDEGTGEVEARLDDLARQIAARGVRRIRGDLVLDEGTFAEPSPATGWPSKSQHWAAYCALPGGLTVNGGVLRATLSKRGSGLDVHVHPAPHGLRENYSVKVGTKNDVRVGATRTSCTVKGEIPAANVSAFEGTFAHPDPVDLFGSVFRASLQRAGIEVDGDVVRRRDAASEDAHVLGVLTTPVLDVLVPINTHSTNGVAEQLLLVLGDRAVNDGSRHGGMRAVQEVLRGIGIPTEGYAQADGSGLSRDNRVTARQLTALLEAAYRMPGSARDAFFSSLAVAGRTGTLERRMLGTPAEGRVFAKTGWIEGASSLSGLIQTPDGRAILFSILVSYPRSLGGMNRRVFKPMQDDLVLALLGDAR